VTPPSPATPPEIVVRARTPTDDPAILASFNAVFAAIWGASYVPRTLAHVRWQYANRGLGHRAAVAVDAQARALTFWGGVPMRVDTEFGPLSFVHSCDNFAVAEQRDTGLYVRTAQLGRDLCIGHGDALGFGFPMPAAHRFDQRYLGTRDLGEVDYLCRDVTDDLPAPTAVRVCELTHADPAIDALYAEVRRTHRCIARRDAAYIGWRYFAAPEQGYRVFGAYRGERLVGLDVIRPYHELRPGACCIVDRLVPHDDIEAGDALLAASQALARACNRTTLLTSFAPWSAERRALCARGFRVVPSADTLAHPLVCLILDPRLSHEWLSEHWWMTLGDSDLG
jgi:hypothetical protein